MSNKELNNYKKSDAAKWWLTLVGFILTGVILVGMMLGIITPVQMEGKNPTTAEQTETVSASQVLARPMLARGMKLFMAETPDALADDDSVTINATLTAELETYNDVVNWEIAFADPSSAWASGKTLSNYVTMTVMNATHSVQVDCVAAFGEPIVITATSADNPDCTASCQLDYVKRITSVSDFYINSDPTYGTSYKNYIRMEMTNTVTAFVEYGVGTISPNIDIISMSMVLSSTFQDAIRKNIAIGSMTAVSATNSIVACTPVQSTIVSGSFTVGVDNFYVGGGDTRSLNNLLYQAAYNAATGSGAPYCNGKPTIKIDVTYGEKTYQTFSYTYSDLIPFEKGALNYIDNVVTSLTIDKDSIVF